ncbi:hypothetical protein EFB08_07210 [Rufibacter latericius]|uniref:DUF4595 domain-containing protein n=2 Tax=Rufibacter latericius TaxID=2487040 RepID=A0A3M9MUK1_9BACT|nr:hypothetical protein EFB08_07210 [Rufibacter latericius]
MLLFYLGGCSSKKEEDPEPEPEPVTVKCRLLREQVVNPNPTQSFTREYVFTGTQLIGVEDAFETNPPSSNSIRFEVDANGRISRTVVMDKNGNLLQYFLFEHNPEGLISRVDWYTRSGSSGPQPALSTTREHTYNAQKQLVASKNFQGTGSTRRILSDYTFTYNDKGNLAQVREYRAFNYQSSGAFNDIVVKTTFTHDDKINPYHEYSTQNYLPPGLLIPNLSPNNILTITSMTTLEGTTYGPGSTFDAAPLNFTGKNTYTYTKNNRPATVTGSLGVTRTFTYVCEE